MDDKRAYHQQLLKTLKTSLVGNTQKIRVKKKTISHLFRYEGRLGKNVRFVDLRKFTQPLFLDEKNQTLDVQGLATYETIVDAVLPQGFLPTITPELKSITVGGVIVGIGIEANCHKYGFVHDGLLEADVLLPDGKIVLCTPTNKYADLFYGLANSYGTLGYVLRAKIKLRKVASYVGLSTEKFNSVAELLKAMEKAAAEPKIDYIESLVYSKTALYLTVGTETDKPGKITSIYGDTIFYKEASRTGKIFLTIKDYMFRYDPEWYWNLPEGTFYRFFRKYAPGFIRNSNFYSHYYAKSTGIFKKLSIQTREEKRLEKLFQDWEVPWRHAEALLNFALENVDLEGKPWAVIPIRTPAKASNYPMEKNALYLNLGSYCLAKKKKGAVAYENTKIMDAFCFSHHGIKMLYSTTFLKEKDFESIYGGKQYKIVKEKYDPQKLSPTLFEKTVKAY